MILTRTNTNRLCWSIMTYLRIFFGHMKDLYDWRYVLEKDFNVEGVLIPSLDRSFQERRKQSGATYGVANNVSQPKGARTVADLDLLVFDEND